MIKRTILILMITMLPGSALAGGLLNLWLTPDQQGQFYFERGEYDKSARLFEQLNWKAIAFYKAGDFANAAVYYAKVKTPEGLFMLGNALSKQEKLAPAVIAYEQTLALKPDFEEARFNLDWVKGLLELSNKEYEDVGGTGGKLSADRMVINKQGAKAKGEVSVQQLQAQEGLSDEQIRDLWMRRVQTTPGDFLAYKFAHQLSMRNAESKTDSQ